MSAWRHLSGYREGRAWATNAMLCVVGVGLLLLFRQFLDEHEKFTIGFSGCSGASVGLYAVAVMLVLTQPTDKWTLRIVLGFAVAFFAMTYLGDPFLSSDIQRYVWDGIVQHAHVNPYRYVPGDKALTFLREPNQDVFDNINRRDYAPTIYPPVAQMVYWFAVFFAPTVAAMKMVMVGFTALATVVLMKLLRLMGRRPTDVLLFCWCPLMVWEVGGSGHVDAVVAAWMVLAFLFYAKRMPGWTGFFLGLAVMTKFYPLLLLPVLWRKGDWKMPATLAGVVLVGYSMYLSVGWKVFGFLGSYTKEEGMDSGTRYFLLDYAHTLPGLHGLSVGVFLVCCALTFAAVLFWALRRGLWSGAESLPLALRAGMGLAFAMMLLFSPHYPWYLIWLVPFLALLPRWSLIAYLAAFFYGYTTRFAAPGPLLFLLNKWVYIAVVLGFLVQWGWNRWDLQRWFVVPEMGVPVSASSLQGGDRKANPRG